MTIETHKGTVRRVFFANPDGPFMAGEMERASDGGTMRFAGKCVANVGDIIEVTGEWSTHPRYGPQFQAETGIVRMDESPDGLAHMLATSDEFSGVGPARSRQLVEAALSLSEDGDAIGGLIEFPEEIAARTGVKLDIVERASEILSARRGYFQAVASLVDQGWSSAQAARLIEHFGEGAPGVLRSDPYQVIGRVSRFGFRTVDAVARSMGVSSTDPKRLAAGVAFCLDRIAENGSTWTRRDTLYAQSLAELEPDTLDGERLIVETINEMVESGLIYADHDFEGSEIVADRELVAAETFVFDRLLEMLRTSAPMAAGISVDLPDGLNPGQAAAASGAFRFQASVMSGGAGVGKTYTTRAIRSMAMNFGLKVELCAPTGKASRKLSNATGAPASTIHSLLAPKWKPERGGFVFTKNEDDTLDADLVIVDEISMVDVRLMRSLLRALRHDCRLLLVGDHNQIPSVGPGAILRDVLAGVQEYPQAVHVLREVVRQAGPLARNTTALLDGVVTVQDIPAWGISKVEHGDGNGTLEIVSRTVEAVVTSPEPLQPFERVLDMAWDVQILSPMRKGPLGTYALNARIQRLRQRLLGNQPPDPVEENKSPKPLVGDRVIWTKNDYALGLMNGTQAIVRAFPKGGAVELLLDDGRTITIPAAKRKHLEVAWAITIHKAQGSEWPMVILVTGTTHRIMHDRNLLYTGASRAGESLTIVGDWRGLRSFAQERRSESRQTFGSLFVRGWTTTDGVPLP